MNPEHYVRPDDEPGSEPPTPSVSTLSRMAHRLAYFLFNREPDRTPPGYFPTEDSTRMAAVIVNPLPRHG